MSFERDLGGAGKNEVGPATEAEVNIKEDAISSGIADRILAKLMSETGMTDRPLEEGAAANDYDFNLEIRVGYQDMGNTEQSIAINVGYPSSTTEELTIRSFTVGKVEGKEIVFTPSFGANGDASLSLEQKEVVRGLCSEALGLELKISEKISY